MGIIRDLPAGDYHALKAMSAGGIWNLADVNEGCPLKFFISSPWNPDREIANAHHFDIGSALHLAVLEPEVAASRTVVVRGFTKDGKPSAGYASQDAKDQRDTAYAAGQTPLLPEEMDLVQEMRRAILDDPLVRGAFSGEGESEVTATWTDPSYGVPCKARVDRMLDGGRILVDLKSAASAHPIGWSKALWQHGHFARAAWYLEGFEHALGQRPEEYWFAVVEKKRPWLTAVHKLPLKDLEWGGLVNRMALATFADCIARGEWPGYRPVGANRPRAFVTGIPMWAQYLLHDKSVSGELAEPKVTIAAVKRGARLYAPDMEQEYI